MSANFYQILNGELYIKNEAVEGKDRDHGFEEKLNVRKLPRNTLPLITRVNVNFVCYHFNNNFFRIHKYFYLLALKFIVFIVIAFQIFLLHFTQF